MSAPSSAADRSFPSGQVVVVASYAKGLTMRVARMPVGGETVLAHEWDEGPGGKGSNQAIQAARLGAPVRLVARIGADAYGAEALALWAQEGVDAGGVTRDPEHPTGAGFIILDDAGENRILLHPGANGALTGAAVRDAVAAGPADVLLCGLEIPLEAARAALSAGRDAGATTILNPAPAARLDGDLLGLVDVLAPNQSEARVLLGRPPDDTTDEAELARRLLAMGAGAVILTRGARGVLVAAGTGTIEFPAPPVDVVDSTGAGDAFCGALATGLAAGWELERAARWATAAGALACTALGVVPALAVRDAVDRLAARHTIPTRRQGQAPP